MPEEIIGKVASYFSKIGVAAIEITNGTLSIGDTIKVKGNTSDFTQKVESMQVDNEQIQEAKKGDSIGIKLDNKVRENDVVYKIVE